MSHLISLLQSNANSLLVILGGALLLAPRLQAFSIDGKPWIPQGTRAGLKFVMPMTVIFILANLFLFIVSWFPASIQDTLHTQAPVISFYLGPTVSTACLAAGALYWFWDQHVLRLLGYRLEPLQEYVEGLEVHLSFNVRFL